MKRLFSRREKDRPARNGPALASTVTSVQEEDTSTVKTNGLLAPSMPGVTRRKSSFFLTVMGSSKSTIQSSQSGSDAGSLPPTARSISGSSDASSSFMSTPIDERVTPATSQTPSDTKPWPSWIGSISKGKSRETNPPASSFANALRPVIGTTKPPIRTAIPDDTSDDNDDASESEESHASSWDDLNNDPDVVVNRKSRGRSRTPASGRRQPTPHSKQAQARAVFGTRATAAPITKETSKALANLQALTIDALVPPTCAPPLVQTSSSVPFPRSSNRVQTVATSQRQYSALHTEILRKRLLRRIERRALTETEQESIRVLAKRAPRPRNADQRKLPAAEETYEDSKSVGGGWSKGMKRWAMRPCFEERVVVWIAQPTGVTVCTVQRDSRCSVAALEFSEGAEALAGLHRQNELPPPPSGKHFLFVELDHGLTECSCRHLCTCLKSQAAAPTRHPTCFKWNVAEYITKPSFIAWKASIITTSHRQCIAHWPRRRRPPAWSRNASTTPKGGSRGTKTTCCRREAGKRAQRRRAEETIRRASRCGPCPSRD